MDVLLAASLLLLVAGPALLVVGRWRAVTRLENGTPGSRAWSPSTSVGLVAAAVGALLLIAFVAIASTMEPADGAQPQDGGLSAQRSHQPRTAATSADYRPSASPNLASVPPA